MGVNTSNAFCGILYPEDETHAFAIKLISNMSTFWGWKYFYILHDKDVWTEEDEELDGHAVGELKKPHWHFVIVSSDKKSPNTIAKMLRVTENRVQVCYGLKGALEYLVHRNDNGKYQYGTSSVISNTDYIDYVSKVSNSSTFDDALDVILNLLEEMKNNGQIITFKSLMLEGRKIGQGKYIARNHQFIEKLIKDTVQEQIELINKHR